jgi:thiol-disulfide isomerase/thioredoxin
MNNLINAHPDMFLSKFLLATKEIDVPDPPKDDNGNITDSLFQYQYYKKHFFDNFDVSDARLLRTPIYEDRINYYLDKVVPQIPDSINNEVDKLIEKSRSSDELFRFMLVSLFNKYAKSQIMGMDAVFVHIAEKYYIPEASWSDSAFISKLKSEVAKTKPLLIGKKAPDIQLVEVPAEHFMAAAEDDTLKKNVYVGDFFNLYDIQAKYTVLVFWEADCGHCKKAMPVLHDLYEKKLKQDGVEIIAIHMLSGEEGKIKWVNFVNEHGFYEWINAWNPYDYSYKAKYNVTSTPTVFVLDKDKKIIAKRIGMEQIEEVINAYSAMKNH